MITVGRRACGLGALLFFCAWFYSAQNALPEKQQFLTWLAWLGLMACAFADRLPSHGKARAPDVATAGAVIITLVGVVPRIFQLSTQPFTVTLDEIIYPNFSINVLKIVEEHPWEIIKGSHRFYMPNLGMVLQSALTPWIEPLLAGRLSSMLQGLVSLLATYALARRLFGRTAGLLAITLLAGSFWHISFSRGAYPYMQPMMIGPLALYVVVCGWQERHRSLMFLGGVLLGISVLFYTPARIAVPVAGAWLLLRALIERPGWRPTLRVAAPLTLGFVVMLAPYMQDHGREGLLLRYERTAVNPTTPLRAATHYGLFAAETAALTKRHLSDATSIYHQPGAHLAVGDFAARPVIDHTTLVLFGFGSLLATLALWKPGPSLLALLWIATFLAGQVLTDLPKSAYRAAPLLPVIVIVAALGPARLVDFLGRYGMRVRVAATAAAIVLVAGLTWPANLEAVREQYRKYAIDTTSALGRTIQMTPAGSAPYLLEWQPTENNGVIRYLSAGRDYRDILALADDLGTLDPGRGVFFIVNGDMEPAIQLIRRCYPGALPHATAGPPGTHPVAALVVARAALLAGRGCRDAWKDEGILVRYLKDDGRLVRQRLEKWPYRWRSIPGDEDFDRIEWRGRLNLPTPGEVTFRFTNIRSVGSLRIGDQVHIDGSGVASGTFPAGPVPLEMDCLPNPRGSCWVWWQLPGQRLSLVPPDAYLPPPVVDLTAHEQ